MGAIAGARSESSGRRRRIVHADTAPDGLVAAIERSDAVVNLAGEPLMGGRWTAARRAVLEGSRIAVTEQLVKAMAEAKSRPRVFISGSAVGYYGDRADEQLTEESRTADDFLARLCRRWECAAQEPDRLGARVVLLRTGSRQPSFVAEAPAQAASVAWTYTVLGVEHILAGIDHLLYIIAMLSRNGLEAHRLADVGVHDTPDVERGSPGLGPMCRNRRWKRSPAILLTIDSPLRGVFPCIPRCSSHSFCHTGD